MIIICNPVTSNFEKGLKILKIFTNPDRSEELYEILMIPEPYVKDTRHNNRNEIKRIIFRLEENFSARYSKQSIINKIISSEINAMDMLNMKRHIS